MIRLVDMLVLLRGAKGCFDWWFSGRWVEWCLFLEWWWFLKRMSGEAMWRSMEQEVWSCEFGWVLTWLCGFREVNLVDSFVRRPSGGRRHCAVGRVEAGFMCILEYREVDFGG